jgi:hypothetical protein
MKPDYAKWVSDLISSGAVQASALEDLHQIILSALSYALQSWLSRANPGCDPVTEEIAQVTLLRILDRLDAFDVAASSPPG